MNIHIEIIYFGSRSDILRKGNFPVNSRRFNEDPDRAAAEVALNWIWEIRREHHVGKIIKVTYNKEHEITDLVMELGHL